MREELQKFATATDGRSIETSARELAASIFEARHNLGDTHELLMMLANQQSNVIGIVYKRFRDKVIQTIGAYDETLVLKPEGETDSDTLADSGIFKA